MKIISEVLSTRTKNVLPFLICSSQMMYVKNRFISESGRVISDILEISNSLALEGFLVTVDIEKAFDSVNHCFLLQILRKFGFRIDFVNWIKNNPKVKGLNIFKHEFLYTAYADDTTFFLKDRNATYFQNVHLHCKNSRLLEYKSSADIY